jgi:hypothetical protein
MGIAVSASSRKHISTPPLQKKKRKEKSSMHGKTINPIMKYSFLTYLSDVKENTL